MTNVRVDGPSASYEVRIRRGSISDLAGGWPAGRRALVIADENTSGFARSLANLPGCVLFAVPAGEATKDLAWVGRACSAAAGAALGRDSAVVAVGGGVVGDLAGVVAATYLRGVDLVQVPTTLLAMVDSSLGGKAAVNLPEGKNLVGAFKPPIAVHIDPELLGTLPEREYRSGLAEIAKYSMISDERLFETLLSHREDILQRDLDLMTTIIATCCGIKGGVVSRDETERGERAILNYGHTFGHALETAAGYGRLTHGEAISVGMTVAADIGSAAGVTPEGVASRQAELLSGLGLPTAAPGVAAMEDVLALMRHDKKAKDGTLRWVLLEDLGRATFGRVVPDELVEPAVSRALGAPA